MPTLDKTIKPLILTPNILKLLKEIHFNPRITITELSKKTNLTYTTTHKIVKQLQKHKLITTKEQGRTKELTTNTHQLLEKIRKINEALLQNFSNKKGKISFPLLIFLIISGLLIAVVIAMIILTYMFL